MAGAADFEGLGVFYLGRVIDPDTGATSQQPLLYESRDLTTHAVCLGMTGSGKTGLCIGLLEEAALDGVPAVAIDPKGDLANLALAFPGLSPQEFRPWIDPAEAARREMTPDALAADEARRWREGLAAWGQDAARVRRFVDAVDLAVWTPGSEAGRPLAPLRYLDAPAPAVLADPDARRERVGAVVSSLLALLGIEADPLQSREHVLLSNLLERAWSEGRASGLEALAAEVARPPFEKFGVLELESFYPARERFELAARLNQLLAQPGFAAWREGEPLDFGRLLYTPEGRPRLSIVSIAHLGDRERMFAVTLLLHEAIAWMRAQTGTASLRAILYMDEIQGYFPPTANPPAKPPMLTLLKQARAFGLGVVLSTQNPVDLDYKGLSNAGTWLLGRLQTERDRERVLDGLEAAGAGLERAALARTLAGLRKRAFFLHDVHADGPVLFESRWALSYLRGPLAREEIRRLARAGVGAERASEAPPAQPAAAAQARRAGGERPLLPPEVKQLFARPSASTPVGVDLVWRPALLGRAAVHYADRAAGVDHSEDFHALVSLEGAIPSDPWPEAEVLETALASADEPPAAGAFAPLPAEAARPASYRAWTRALGDWLARERRLELLRCRALGRFSAPGQGEGEFRAALAHAAHERRDAALEALRKRYAPKLASLRERLERAQERAGRERDQQRSETVQAAVSIGSSVLGAIFGRKLGSARNVGRVTTAARGAGRVQRERRDVARAEERIEDLREELAALESELESESAALAAAADPAGFQLEPHPVRPRKSDLRVEPVTLCWVPCFAEAGGGLRRVI